MSALHSAIVIMTCVFIVIRPLSENPESDLCHAPDHENHEAVKCGEVQGEHVRPIYHTQ